MNLIKMTLSISLILTGCSNYRASFDCPIGKGLKCASLSEVNEKIDDGSFSLEPTKASCPGPGCHKVHWREDLFGQRR